MMRGRIVDAALHTLTSTGYANTSVRAIATTGGFSPALVFYHFGSVDALLLAVLDRISGERLFATRPASRRLPLSRHSEARWRSCTRRISNSVNSPRCRRSSEPWPSIGSSA